MYDHTLHRDRKHFCRYGLQAFSTEEILKPHVKDCFKLKTVCAGDYFSKHFESYRGKDTVYKFIDSLTKTF